MYSYILGKVVITIKYIHKFAVSSLLESGCLTRQNFRVKILKDWYSRRKYLMVFLEMLKRQEENITCIILKYNIEADVNESGE